MDEPSFRVALYTFRDLGKKDEHKKQFIFLVRKQFEGLFHLQMGDSIFIHNADPEAILFDEKE